MLLEEILNDTHKQKEFFAMKLAYLICPFKLNEIIKNEINKFNLIDVRDYENYIDGHIPFAKHIPIDEFKDHYNMLDKDKINIIYCDSLYCMRATKACYLASEKGYKTKMLLGGFKIWKKLQFDVVKTSS